MNFLYKNYKINELVEFYILAIFLIFPKIDLLDLPYYHQGIRLEDILILTIFFLLFYLKKIEIKSNDVGNSVIFYFFILCVSCLIGSIYFDQKWIIIIRYIEYIVVIIYYNRRVITTDTIFKLLKLYLVLNLFFVILQKLSMMGEFSSLGYENPIDRTDSRPTGLTGGPWELANCSAIIFFCLLMEKKKSFFFNFIFLSIAIYLMIATQSRTIVLSFSLALIIYFYQRYVDIKKFPVFLILFIISTLLIISVTNYIEINSTYSHLLTMFKNAMINFEETKYAGGNFDGIDYKTLDGKLWSVAIRIDHWLHLYKQFLTNQVTILFGTGSTTVYYESTIFRILFGTGIIGLVYVCYCIRKVPIYILVFLFTSGLTLDLLLSFKIFFMLFLYFYLIKNIEHENRN